MWKLNELGKGSDLRKVLSFLYLGSLLIALRGSDVGYF